MVTYDSVQLKLSYPNVYYCGKNNHDNVIYTFDENRPIKATILFSGIGRNVVISINGCTLIVPEEKIMISYTERRASVI